MNKKSLLQSFYRFLYMILLTWSHNLAHTIFLSKNSFFRLKKVRSNFLYLDNAVYAFRYNRNRKEISCSKLLPLLLLHSCPMLPSNSNAESNKSTMIRLDAWRAAKAKNFLNVILIIYQKRLRTNFVVSIQKADLNNFPRNATHA